MMIDELWMSLRSALLKNKIERIPSFVLRRPIFAFFRVSFSIRPAIFLAGGADT
jgi:hypothetical protein